MRRITTVAVAVAAATGGLLATVGPASAGYLVGAYCGRAVICETKEVWRQQLPDWSRYTTINYDASSPEGFKDCSLKVYLNGVQADHIRFNAMDGPRFHQNRYDSGSLKARMECNANSVLPSLNIDISDNI
ncbi:hypothetical protein [Amycolatopsis pittospori]|uniref:hypothetical protein n=1 Tax=Amycolatopsis pittospori TaxID=2749434 RepID=UPI0015F0722C|nr:hypothetical protein [Amycolatopsis pittospori]